ncbi:P27 family phage terminase small subunit [Paracoccaceae bacterium]|nr:P27 family phage terminase small subunit [Paracoccaceae bacterium]
MKKRTDKNSATAAVAGFAGVIDDAVLPPAGVELRNENEHLIWSQFTRACAKSDWRYMDLILLAKIVRMEADIRTAQAELDAVGMMVENKRGTQIPNPLISVIDTLERRQLAVIRSMSLNQTASDPRTLNGTAKGEAQARTALKDVGVAGLIGQPMN